LLVIESKVGDAGHDRSFDNVGGVKTSAEPDFKDARVRTHAREGENGRRCRDFEEAWLDVASGVENLHQQFGKTLIVDQATGNTDPLVETNEVRARKGMDGVTAGFESGSKEGDGRPFAVGPRDMKDRR
jgi:hypothetical protein